MGRVVGETGVGKLTWEEVNRKSLSRGHLQERGPGPGEGLGEEYSKQRAAGTKVGMSLECQGAVRRPVWLEA